MRREYQIVWAASEGGSAGAGWWARPGRPPTQTFGTTPPLQATCHACRATTAAKAEAFIQAAAQHYASCQNEDEGVAAEVAHFRTAAGAEADAARAAVEGAAAAERRVFELEREVADLEESALAAGDGGPGRDGAAALRWLAASEGAAAAACLAEADEVERALKMAQFQAGVLLADAEQQARGERGIWGVRGGVGRWALLR